MTRARWAILAIAGALTVTGMVVSSAVSCAATPTIPPLRSFESAKDIDVVCMQVLTTGADGGVAGVPIAPPVPVNQQFCAPVPVNQIGSILPYHLFALVTQAARGEVAVVDLTAGQIIDEDPSTPGINFLPVGANPSGIAAAPDGRMTFVASADPTKPAIYALDSTRILGAGVNYDSGVVTPYSGPDARSPVLTSWPACSLPQVPGPILVIPTGPLPPDAAVPYGPEAQGYTIAVVLPGDGQRLPARVVMLDPQPFLRGAGIDIGPGPAVQPGSLSRCPVIGQAPLAANVPSSPGVGPSWDDGVKYVIEGGPNPLTDAGLAEAGALGYVGPPVPLPLPQFTCADGGPGPYDASFVLTPTPFGPGLAQATAAARAGTILYVGDKARPLIHVFDVGDPTNPKELAPLVATSLEQPSRIVSIGGLAVSPFTRDYRRYLYAVDQKDSPASIIVYDITDPIASPHVPLTRPHPELAPQAPLDRIQFGSPVAAVAFASHDFPLTQNPFTGGNIIGAAGSGLLCNPNTNVDIEASVVQLADGEVVDAAFKDPGAFYRYNFSVQGVQLGPARLRGIFGFATLSNGDVMLIDVDDWDSPCRRPFSMSGFSNDIAPPEINTPDGESVHNPLDPYQEPEAGTQNGVPYVTNEVFFPVSQPHRARSQYPLNVDPLLGPHIPQLQVQPQLFNLQTQAGLGACADAGQPCLLPAGAARLADFSGYDGGTGVRLSWEDPLVHQNQNWTVTYEGALPTFSGIQAAIQTNPADPKPYETLVVSIPNGGFCGRGVEDVTVGQERVAAAVSAGAGSVVFPPNMDQWVGDYVQFGDEIPAIDDPYWSAPNDCWDNPPQPALPPGRPRYQACLNYFQPVVQQLVTRDYPILQAYDDHFIVSRFGYPVDNGPDGGMADAGAFPIAPATTNRFIMGPDPSNVPYMQAAKCCFHGLATINVRAGGEWLASGSTSGLAHHVTVDPVTGRCVLSCDPQFALLNARELGFFPKNPSFVPDRNSPLAMRNPMLSFFVTQPVGPNPQLAPNDPRYNMSCSVPDNAGICSVQRPARDLAWEFTTINSFVNQSVNLAGSGTQLSPQSMLFIQSLGQLAVVDGAQEGLVLIDLSTVAVSGTPFF